MNSIGVLLPCSNIHTASIVRCLKENPENRPVRVYATNNMKSELPDASICDGVFVVPPVNEGGYIKETIRICKDNGIGYVMPISSIDLEELSAHKPRFALEGIKVSVMDYDRLKAANSKKKLHEVVGEYMPEEIVTSKGSEAVRFAEGRKVCIKSDGLCGGKGFAVVDNAKSLDIGLFHRYGKKHYISLKQMEDAIDLSRNEVIVQEYREGLDYSVCALCDNGKVVCMIGYAGHILEFGSVMYGEVMENKKAFGITGIVAERMCLDGNVCLDFIIDHEGNAVLLEVNPRINASMGLCAAAGCNLAWMQLARLSGESLDGMHIEIRNGMKMKKDYAERYFL